MPGLDEHFMVSMSGCSFGLIPPTEEAWRTGRARAQNLAAQMGGAVPVDQRAREPQPAGSICDHQLPRHAPAQPPVAGVDLERRGQRGQLLVSSGDDGFV